MKKIIIAIVAVILVAIVLSTTLYTVKEDQTAIVMRFGEIIAVCVHNPTPEIIAEIKSNTSDSVKILQGAGLKFKAPFVDSVIPFTRKLISYDTQSRLVITSDKKTLQFNNNAQWRIDNPVQFYKSVRDISTAGDRIDNILYSRMNDRIGKMDAHTLITDKNEVSQMLKDMTAEVSASSKEFGVTVVDVRIKRTDTPEGNYQSIYQRMISERQRVAQQYRSEGDEEAVIIRSTTDREAITITSEANKTAEILKGEGDSEAARIFNEAYGKNPEFFEFYNLLNTYQTTIGSSSTLVIPLDSPFAKYLLGIPNVAQAVTQPPTTVVP